MMAQLGVYCILVVASSVAGGLIPLIWHGSRARMPDLLCISAGFMVGAIFFHMLPEAIELLGRNASYGLLAGFIFLYILERFMRIHACEGDDCHVHDLGALAYIGMSIHTLTDGLALGAAMIDPALGFTVFLAIIAHKLPSAFSLSAVLAHSGYTRRRIIVLMAFFGLLVPAGAAIFMLAEKVFHCQGLEGYAVAFACGSFLHIALSDLIPEMHRAGSSRVLHTALFLGGVGVMLVLSLVAGH